MNKKRFSLPALLAVFILLAVLAIPYLALEATAAPPPKNQDHYSLLSAVPSITMDHVTAAHSEEATTAPITSLYKATNGNPKATARILGNTSGGTVTLSCYLWHYDNATSTWTFLTKQDAAQLTLDTSVTGTANNEVDAWYGPPNPPEWDTRGATHYEVRLLQISAGAVNVRPWSYGAKSE